MREIKFKAWSHKYKEMFHGRDVDLWGQPKMGRVRTVQGRIDVNAELLQYTGLKDKNGKDIYEGDIVIWNDGSGKTELNPKKGWIRKAIIKIDPDIQLQLTKDTPSGKPDYIFHYGSFIYKHTKNHLKIIGNIYENPELIC